MLIFEITHQFCLAGRCWCCSEVHRRLQGGAIHSTSPYYHAPLARPVRPDMTHWASLQCNQDHTVKHQMESSPHFSCLLPSSCFCSGEQSKCKLSPAITNWDLSWVSCVKLIQPPPAVGQPALWRRKKQETTYFDVNKTLGFVMDKTFS